jgi:hypothetical protein
MVTITVLGSGAELTQSDDLFILTADNAEFDLSKGSENNVFVTGNNDTIHEDYASNNNIYDLAKNLSITFAGIEFNPTMTVYNFYQASGAHVTLSASFDQTATETPYRDGYTWGTKVTVGGHLQGVMTAFFPYTQHVNVVTAL